MKKLIILFILVSLIFVGCKAASEASVVSEVNEVVTEASDVSETIDVSEIEEISSIEEVVETTEDSVNLSNFPEVKPIVDNIDYYRNDINKRANGSNGDQFLYDYESNILRDTGYYVSPHGIWVSTTDEAFAEVSVYYYPVVYRYGKGLVLWYTTEVGDLKFETIYGNTNSYFSNFGGKVHLDESTDDEIIGMYEGIALSYNSDDGIVSQWQCGQVNYQCNVPVGAEYCGYSKREGYLFRSGTDVYSLNLGGDAVCIAHGVKYVIEANYSYNSDASSQPLFLMGDGQILAYVGFESFGEDPDNSSHLLSPLVEGGYR